MVDVPGAPPMYSKTKRIAAYHASLQWNESFTFRMTANNLNGAQLRIRCLKFDIAVPDPSNSFATSLMMLYMISNITSCRHATMSPSSGADAVDSEGHLEC